MTKNDPQTLEAENHRLQTRLEELETALQAIRAGEVDGVIPSPGTDPGTVYRLEGADAPYRILVETMNEGAVTLGTDGMIVYGNSHFAQMIEVAHERIIGRWLSDFARPQDRPLVQAFLERCTHGNSKEEFYLVTSSGREFPVLCSYGALTHGTSLGLNIVLTDLTERRKSEESQLALERQLLHAQKLESLGVLAGGIAHDFNNILMAMVGHIELALLRLPSGGPETTHLHQAKAAGYRAADLTKQLLAYTGKGRFLLEVVDLNKLVAEVLPMLRVTVPKNIELDLRLGTKPAWIRADAGQIHQVLMNLVINGADAIGEAPGSVTIEVKPVRREPEPGVEAKATLERFIEVSVTDTGCGMDEATIRQVYDPFFTTKFTGRGLGLAAVQGIVAGHRGHISIQSQVGEGSCFRVLFPSDTRTPRPEALPSTTDLSWRGWGTALLVEDEEDVRNVNALLLEELGFEVVEARNGTVALEEVARSHQLTVVVLDLVLPGIPGPEVLQRLRTMRPHLPVLLASGHSDTEIRTKIRNAGPTASLQKPFDLESLRQALREVLSR